jgi:hypothetical protein
MGTVLAKGDGSKGGGQGKGSLKTFSELQMLYLVRLAKVVVKLRDSTLVLKPNDFHLIMLRKAVFSTYLSCLKLRCAKEAQDIINRGGLVGSQEIDLQ